MQKKRGIINIQPIGIDWLTDLAKFMKINGGAWCTTRVVEKHRYVNILHYMQFNISSFERLLI